MSVLKKELLFYFAKKHIGLKIQQHNNKLLTNCQKYKSIKGHKVKLFCILLMLLPGGHQR